MKDPLKLKKPKNAKQTQQAGKGKGQGAFGKFGPMALKTPYEKPKGAPKKKKA